MSDRRTFLGNAGAAALIAKISPLRSLWFTLDDPQTIHPIISDREKAGLRGPVKQYTEETIIPGVEGRSVSVENPAEAITEVSYNEHGDKSEERVTPMFRRHTSAMRPCES